MATELAKAYVQIIPSAQGISGSISDILSGESTEAGAKSGENIAASLGKNLKKALVGLGIGKIIMDAIGDTSEFSTSMAKVSTLFTGTDEELQTLQSDILSISSAYGLGATTLAEAAYSAESAGVPMENLTELLSGSAQLAIAGFTDIDTALSATAKTMNAYGDAAGSVEDIQKILIQTQNLGITTVGELGASLANVTPTAAAMGVSFDQVGAAMAQMTAQGVPTAQATTQLRSAMTELGKSGTTADKSFRAAAAGTKYAGMSFQEAIASGANLGDVFSMMQSYADASGKSMVDLWGSVEAGNAAMMIASDVETFNSNLEAMGTDADVVGDAYSKMSDTLGTSINRLKESATNFMSALFTGGDVSASFDAMLDSLGDIGSRLLVWLTNGVKALGQNLPNMMKSLLDFGESLLSALGEVDWIDLGTTVVTGIIGAMGELGTRLAALLTRAVKDIAGGQVDFGEIGRALLGGLSTVVESVAGIAQDILDAIIGVLAPEDGENPIASFFKTGEKEVKEIDWEALGQSVASAGASLINLSGEALAGGFTAAESLIKAINWEKLGETVGTVGNGLVGLTGEILTAGFTAARDILLAIDWGEVGSSIQSGLGDVWSGLTGLLGGVLGGAGEAASGVGSGIGAAAEGIGKGIARLINGDDAKQAAEDLKQAMTDLESALTTSKTSLEKTAADVSSGMFKALKEDLSPVNMNDIGDKIVTGITAGMGLKMADLSTKVTEMKDGITAGFEGEDGHWSGVGETIVTGIETGIGTKFGDLNTKVGTAMDLVKQTMETKDWNSVGVNIIAGIVTGVNNARERLVSVMKSVAVSALTAVRSALGISSPSSVMRDQIGRWIPAGIAAGIEEYAGLVDGAMNDLASDMASGRMRSTIAGQTRSMFSGSGSQTNSGGTQMESLAETQNALLREQNTLLRRILEKDNSVKIGASVNLGRTVKQSLDMYSLVGG